MTVTPYDAAENWSFQELDLSEPFFIFQIAFLAACAIAIFICALKYELSRRSANRSKQEDKTNAEDQSDISSGDHDAENNPKNQLEEVEVENERRASEELPGSKWLIGIALVNFAFMVATIFSVMVGRLVVLWQIAPEYFLKLNDETGQLVFMNNRTYYQDNPSDEELEAMGCGGLVIDDRRNFTDPDEDYFKFLAVPLGPNSFKSTFAVFSIILGLVVYILLQALIGFMEYQLGLKLERRRLEGTLPSNWFTRQIHLSLINLFCGYVVFLLLESQQSLVLMPLTYVTPTPYCFVIDSPAGLPEETFVKFFVWSIAGIPIGVPVAVAGWVIVKACGAQDDDDGGSMVTCLFYFAGWAMVVSGLGLFGCWLLLGCVIGAWSFFYSKFVVFTQTTTLLAELFAPAMFLTKDMLQGICELLIGM